MLLGGAEISTASADTTTPQQLQWDASVIANTTPNVAVGNFFSPFNTSLGTLDSVHFSLDSNIEDTSEFLDLQVTATVTVAGLTLFTTTMDDYSLDNFGPFSDSSTIAVTPGGSGLADADLYTSGIFLILASLNIDNCESGMCSAHWDGGTFSSYEGITVYYEYTPAAVPLPGALPMFATGLGALGLLGMRSRRKRKAKEQS